MKRILVAGSINIETTLKVSGFPLEYTQVHYNFFGVNSSVSGVGYNAAKALTTLGNRVDFCSLVGKDLAADTVRAELCRLGICDARILAELPQTLQSVIMYDPTGKRMVQVDLKNIQETTYPAAEMEPALADCDLAVLCNINFSRPFLRRARELGKPVATDVHVLSDLDDDYNRDYMQAANILFMSNERLPAPPEEFARWMQGRYGTDILVIGLGAEGALLAVRRDGYMGRIPAVSPRPIVSTIGAGDALFSSFVHIYAHTADPYLALRKAVVFAGYKIGVASASEGYLDAPGLDSLCEQVYGSQNSRQWF